MKRRFGLQGRIYVYGMAMLLLSIVASSLVTRYVIQPLFDVPMRPSTTWIAWHVAQIQSEPERVRSELADLRARVGIEMSLFTPSGELVVSNADAPPKALSQADLQRFRAEPTSFDDGRGRVGIFDEAGELTHYVLTSYPQPSALGLALGQIAVALVLLAFLVIPLARFIARPVRVLVSKTRAFGEGDLSVRTGLAERSDEIGDLASAFDEMAERITALRRTELELLANVSHELRTPLSRIRLALELIRDGDASKADRYAEDIAEELVELEQLLDDVMTTARLDLARGVSGEGLPPLRQERVPGDRLVAASASRFARHHPERRLDCSLPPKLPEVYVDPVLLRRVLDNLIDNAAKFSDAEAPIELRAATTRDDLELRVIDRGMGIAASDLDRIFDPFYRADKSRARATGGVGLGLALAKRIIQAHGGSIGVSSTPGQGSCFTVSLPLAR